jgi:small subunit ribosomal protein S17
MEKEITQKRQKTLKGKVVSNKMDKTVVVAVGDFVKQAKYGKFQVRTKKYKAHDPENKCKEGDIVLIQEVRPISKDKCFTVVFK